MALLPLGKIRAIERCPLCTEADVWDLSVFVTEWQEQIMNDQIQIIYNGTLYETLRQTRLYNIALGNLNLSWLNMSG